MIAVLEWKISRLNGISLLIGEKDERLSGLRSFGMQPDEINVAAIHHINGSRLQFEQVEGMNIVQRAVGEAGSVALQVDQRVHLYGCFIQCEQEPMMRQRYWHVCQEAWIFDRRFSDFPVRKS